MTVQLKIFTDANELKKSLEALRHSGKRIVFTNGCFDILHVGHVQTLRHARGLGDALVVGVNDDASVERLKGKGRPVLPLDQCLRILAGLADVDYVIVFSEDTPERLICDLRPEVLVKGGDYRLDQVVGREAVLSWGGRVEVAPPVEDVSTRQVIETIVQRFGSKR